MQKKIAMLGSQMRGHRQPRKWKKKRTSMQKKIAMLGSQERATDSQVNGEEENKYATKIAMLESQVKATDSHVN